MVDNNFFHYAGELTLKKVLDITGCSIYGDGHSVMERKFSSIATLDEADSCDIASFHNAKYLEAFQRSKAGACITFEKFAAKAPDGMLVLVSDSPHRAFAKLGSAFYSYKRPVGGVTENSAVVDKTALIGDDVYIGHNVVIKENVKIGDGSIIEDNTVIYDHVEIGSGCHVYSSASIMFAKIANNVSIGHGTRVGQRGFGFNMDKSGYIDVLQLGLVIIEDNVRIGSNCIIDRGALKNTIIGKNTQIADLVQIAHNVEVGSNTIIVSQTGVAGSAKIGNMVMIGGQVGINGHIEIGDGVKIAGGSGVVRSLKAGESVGGYPAMPIMQWHKMSAMLKKFLSSTYDEKS